MKTENTNSHSEVLRILSWIFATLFLVIGVLNLFLVHPVPGFFYLVFSFIYFPQVDTILKKRFGFSIPLFAKIIFGFVLLWGTLAVGDLAETLGL